MSNPVGPPQTSREVNDPKELKRLTALSLPSVASFYGLDRGGGGGGGSELAVVFGFQSGSARGGGGRAR